MSAPLHPDHETAKSYATIIEWFHMSGRVPAAGEAKGIGNMMLVLAAESFATYNRTIDETVLAEIRALRFDASLPSVKSGRFNAPSGTELACRIYQSIKAGLNGCGMLAIIDAAIKSRKRIPEDLAAGVLVAVFGEDAGRRMTGNISAAKIAASLSKRKEFKAAVAGFNPAGLTKIQAQWAGTLDFGFKDEIDRDFYLLGKSKGSTEIDQAVFRPASEFLDDDRFKYHIAVTRFCEQYNIETRRPAPNRRLIHAGQFLQRLAEVKKAEQAIVEQM